MPNPFIPRETVHAWSEEIGDHPDQHNSSLQRLIKQQRRLTRWIEENRAPMQGATAGVSIYLTGVVARMFEMAGGRLKGATWAMVREVESDVQGKIAGLLPLDGFLDRLHAFGDRAQPHILDEAAMVLFEAERRDNEEPLDEAESLKVLAVLWVVIEVLDRCWRPPGSFEGEAGYTYVHIDPPSRDEGPGDEED